MKKFIIVILVLAVCAAAVYFGYPEISKLIDKEQTTASSEVNSSADVSSEDSQNSSETADSSSEVQTSNVSSEGGNSGEPEKFALEITISEDKYFVDNHEISFEELKTKIDGLEKGSAVKINDENSALKAFNSVKNYLAEKEIAYSVE